MNALCNELNSFFYTKTSETSYSWEVIKGAFLDYLEEKKEKKEPLSKILHLSYYESEDANSPAKAILNCDVVENVLTFAEVCSCKELAEANGLYVFDNKDDDDDEGLFISFVFTASNLMPGAEDFV